MMERVLVAAVWGAAAAAAFGAAGALFGAVARVVVRRRHTPRDRTRGRVIADGARGGGVLLAVVGLFAGVGVGGLDLAPDARLKLLTSLFLAAVLLMFGAVAFGALASLLEWLLCSGKAAESQTADDAPGDG
jgi:hypothetical protein